LPIIITPLRVKNAEGRTQGIISKKTMLSKKYLLTPTATLPIAPRSVGDGAKRPNRNGRASICVLISQDRFAGNSRCFASLAPD